MATLRWKPTGGVGLNNFDKHAINTRLTPAVAAAAAKLGVPLLDTRPAFGGRPACPKKARSWRCSSSAARPPAGWICLIPGCSTQHPRAQRARVAQIATRGYGPMVQASAHVTARAFALSTRPGCPANVSACCALLARDGLHTTSAGAVAVARIVHAWVRASAPRPR